MAVDFDTYQEAAWRTANGNHDDPRLAISNWAMGLAGETGELVDLLKKGLFHGRGMSLREIESEAGDVLWYLSALCKQSGISLQRVAENNIRKLEERYPDGFVKGGGIRPDEVAAPRVRRCEKCGAPEHNHPYRHRFVAP